MKAFIISLLLILTTSCIDKSTIDEQAKIKYGRRELDSTSQYNDRYYKVYTLEGCEYIVVGGGNIRWGSHKGNCKNHGPK